MAENTRKGRAAKPSIASHPLFPGLVTLWFGALFGLVSLAIRPALLEGVVIRLGLDRVIPMAAPPLGHTARLLIVLGMTVLGCLIGFAVARVVAKPIRQQFQGARRRSVSPPAQAVLEDGSVVGMFGAALPATAQDEDEDHEPVRRRRQLAMSAHDETFDERAPLPGTQDRDDEDDALPELQILDVNELPLKSFDEIDEVWLHSSVRAQPVAAEPVESIAEPRDTADVDAHHAPTSDAAEQTDDDVDPRSNRLFESYVRRVNAGVGSNDGDAAPTPGFVSLRAEDVQPAREVTEPAAMPGEGAAYANAAERIARAPLDSLSHVELLERLAQTIARRRANAAIAAREPSWMDTAPVAATAAPVPDAMPAALRPHWTHSDDEADDALPATIPARSIAMAPAAGPVAGDPSTAQDSRAPEHAEPSPLAAPSTAKSGTPEFVRIEEPEDDTQLLPQPPVFSFPGLHDVNPPASSAAPERRPFDAPRTGDVEPDQTEQALRAALATLRRMSGAA